MPKVLPNLKNFDAKNIFSRWELFDEKPPASAAPGFDEYTGVSLNKPESYISMGSKEEIKLFRDEDGRLKIVAPGIDFVSTSVTVENDAGKLDFKKFQGIKMSKPTKTDF